MDYAECECPSGEFSVRLTGAYSLMGYLSGIGIVQ